MKKNNKSQKSTFPYRYVMWAAPANPSWLDWALKSAKTREKKAPFPDSIWPIVDNDTCGVIDGSPRPDQYFCICFDSESQKKVFDALNGIK